MSRNHVQPGKVIDVTLSATFASGDLIKVGDLAGVCLGAGDSGDTISVQIDEVFTVPKLSSDDMSQGDEVYLDHANKRVQLASGDDGGSPPVAFIVAGKVVTAAGNGVTTVNLKLNA